MVKAPNEKDICKRGDPVECGQKIRLEHLTTHKNLHSHHFSSPLSSDQVGNHDFGLLLYIWYLCTMQYTCTWQRCLRTALNSKSCSNIWLLRLFKMPVVDSYLIFLLWWKIMTKIFHISGSISIRRERGRWLWRCLEGDVRGWLLEQGRKGYAEAPGHGRLPRHQRSHLWPSHQRPDGDCWQIRTRFLHGLEGARGRLYPQIWLQPSEESGLPRRVVRGVTSLRQISTSDLLVVSKCGREGPLYSMPVFHTLVFTNQVLSLLVWNSTTKSIEQLYNLFYYFIFPIFYYFF